MFVGNEISRFLLITQMIACFFHYFILFTPRLITDVERTVAYYFYWLDGFFITYHLALYIYTYRRLASVVVYGDAFAKHTGTASFAVVCNGYLSLVARHDRLECIFGYGTSARCISLMDDKW